MFNNTLCREWGAGPCWGCGCPGMAGRGPFTHGGAEAQGRPAQGRLCSRQVQTLQRTLVLSGFLAGKGAGEGGRGLPLAILSLRCEGPWEGLGAWSPDPSTHPSSAQSLPGGHWRWMDGCVDQLHVRLRTSGRVSVSGHLCRPGRAPQDGTWGLGAPLPTPPPETVCNPGRPLPSLQEAC